MSAQNRNRLIELGYKWFEKKISPAEKQELETWLEAITDEPLEVTATARSDEEYEAMLFQKIQQQINETPKGKIKPLWTRIAAAASILVILSAGGYFLFHKQPAGQTVAASKHDVGPGGNKAILTLSNGQQVVLNSQQGKIAQQGKTAVLLNANGTVSYATTATGPKSAELQYNTLTVPIGNRRDMTLADGTEVSLDAGSSITYPVVFNAKERSVSVTGQVYFKVKHNENHPFNVKVKDLTIQDIGTEFNINAYNDESTIKTTLIEGSVKVTPLSARGEGPGVRLKPGQQAVATAERIAVQAADLEAVTAWKNNDFLLRDQDLQTTMRQIARWYNVRIIYDRAPEDVQIWADVSRKRPLSVLLKAIAQAGKVKFKIEGNTVTVTK